MNFYTTGSRHALEKLGLMLPAVLSSLREQQPQQTEGGGIDMGLLGRAGLHTLGNMRGSTGGFGGPTASSVSTNPNPTFKQMLGKAWPGY